MACIIWVMSIILYAKYGLYYMANVNNKIYAEYGLYYMANGNNKYMLNMACIIWLMSIINICRILSNVNNKYMQNCVIWLMSIINICNT